MAILAIDISVYQKGINLEKAKAQGIQAVIAKAGGAECGKFKDSQFETHFANAAKNGLPIGCYFFACCKTAEAAVEEAKYFLTLIAGKSFPVKCWYDIEGSMCNLSKTVLNKIALAFCDTVSAAGYECGVYASASTFNKIDYDGSFSAKHPKWVACWGTTKPSSVKEGRDMWQFSGEKPTIMANVIGGKVSDLDYIYFEIEGTPNVNPAPVEDPVAAPTLIQGSKGSEVVKLQKNLNTFGYNLKTDGDYGPATAAAVKGFQTLTKIGIDSKYGPQTAEKMKEFIK